MSILKELREKHNKEQRELAEYLEISAPNYSKKEAGQVRFSLIEAKKLSEYFNLTIDEIFFNDEVSKQETSGGDESEGDREGI